jgi:UDP:flavonoid glycosyltransferase YjiC (YdhE family)
VTRRVLLVAIPAVGHTVALGSIGAELVARGHEVAWACPLEHPLLPSGAVRFPVGTLSSELALGRTSSVRYLFGVALPGLARVMLPGVEAAIAQFSPDVLVVEASSVAGAIAAQRSGLPWVCVHSAPAVFTATFDGLHGLNRWIDENLAAPQREAGITPLPWPLRGSAGTILTTTPSMLGLNPPVDRDHLLLGPMMDHRSSGATGPGGHAIVSLGTVVAGAHAGLLARAVAAAAARGPVRAAGPADLDWRAAGAGTGADVEVLHWLPLPDLLDGASLLVGHGGHNTVIEALWHGVPALLAPVVTDQPLVAARVVALGAGLRVPLDASFEVLRGAVDRLLDDDRFRASAAALKAELRAAGGTAAAADVVEAA